MRLKVEGPAGPIPLHQGQVLDDCSQRAPLLMTCGVKVNGLNINFTVLDTSFVGLQTNVFCVS